MNEAFIQTAEQIIKIGQQFYQRGWSVATSSNYSCKVDAQTIAITVSGKHKGQLTHDDIMVVDTNGNPLNPNQRPSAETALHTMLYRHDANIGAVLHTHSVNATVLSRLYSPIGQLPLNHYEMLKALDGVTTHETATSVPIFANSQDMDELAKQVQALLMSEENSLRVGFLLSGHGLYTWGATLEDANRHVEALEFMFECEVLTLQLRTSVMCNMGTGEASNTTNS